MNPSVQVEHAPLHLALTLSEEILAAIEIQDWDTVQELDQKRRIIIDQYFKTSAPFDEKLTRELKMKNDEIVALLINHQQKIRSSQLYLNRASKVSRAYQANTSASVRK